MSSRRTAAAARAVRDAWEREQELVQNGRGTRDWTPDQQQSIIEKGKAYDDDGRAFEGHHMKNVAVNPEYQGDAGNIQFLTRSEHKDAHGGCFGNPTNGYYDYITGETRDFGEGPFTPCEVIELSEPIAVPVSDDVGASEDSCHEETDTQSSPLEEKGITSRPRLDEALVPPASTSGGMLNRIAEAPRNAVDWLRHDGPRILAQYGPEVGKWLRRAAALALVEYAREKWFPGGRSTSGNVSTGSSSSSHADEVTGDSDAYDADSSSPLSPSEGADHHASPLSPSEGADHHASPEQHTVRGHEQRYHTKEGVVTKTKQPYRRGGN